MGYSPWGHKESDVTEATENHTASLAAPHLWASLVAQLVKNPPANTGDAGDVVSIPGSGRSPGGGKGKI